MHKIGSGGTIIPQHRPTKHEFIVNTPSTHVWEFIVGTVTLGPVMPGIILFELLGISAATGYAYTNTPTWTN